MHTAQINLYEPEDAVELVEMWRESFEHGVGFKDTNPIAGQLDYFLNEIVPANSTRVAKQDNRIVAAMASNSESINLLYVRVQCIGQGLGTTLIQLAKAESKGSLWLYTFASNTNARRFYERQGFVETERESANMYKREAIKYQWLARREA